MHTNIDQAENNVSITLMIVISVWSPLFVLIFHFLVQCPAAIHRTFHEEKAEFLCFRPLYVRIVAEYHHGAESTNLFIFSAQPQPFPSFSVFLIQGILWTASVLLSLCVCVCVR